MPKLYKPETISSTVALKLTSVVHTKNVQNKPFLETEHLKEPGLPPIYRLAGLPFFMFQKTHKNMEFILLFCFKDQNFDMCLESSEINAHFFSLKSNIFLSVNENKYNPMKSRIH